jgi:DNA-binding NtrC family response regulator
MAARVIATTHRHLDAMVEKGTFRLDLLFRLRVLHVHLPPLRERPGDVEALSLYFLRRVAEAQKKRVASLGPAVTASLLAYPWPGNVRELSNVIEREVSLLSADATVLSALEVPLGGSQLRAGDSWTPETPTVSRMMAVKSNAGAATMPAEIVPLAEVEKRAFLDAFAVCGGNVSRAARALGVSKVTFYAKLRQWGLHPADEGSPPSTRRVPSASVAPDSVPRLRSSPDLTGPPTPRSPGTRKDG